MPFLLGAIPGLASAFGASLPTALAIGLPAASSALGVASGIAQGDPLSAILSGASGLAGGLTGGLAGGGFPGADPQAALSAAQGSTTAAPIMQAGETAASTIPQAARVGMDLHGATDLLQGVAPATKSMGLMDAIGNGLAGASAATQGVLGVIDAFRDKSRGSGMNFGAINSYLPPAQANNLAALPQAPSFEGGVSRTPFNMNISDNDLFYQLMGAYNG